MNEGESLFGLWSSKWTGRFVSSQVRTYSGVAHQSWKAGVRNAWAGTTGP